MKYLLLTNFTVLLLLFIAPLTAQETQPVRFVIDAQTVQKHIDEKIYGHFLEHIYHSINGGLWGELVWNRSFEDVNFGEWKKEGDAIRQTGLNSDQRLTFGDYDWTDFEYTLEARKTGGMEGFLLLFRAKNEKEFYWVNLGGWNNTQHAIERRNAGQSRQGIIGRAVDGKIEENRWYKIRVRCEGTKTEVFLDGQKILGVDDPDGPKHGQCGIGTWSTQAEFRNIKVTSLGGQTLYNELPQPQNIEQVGKHWETFGDMKTRLSSTKSFNGKHALFMEPGENGGGIAQKGFMLKKGEQYAINLWVVWICPAGAQDDLAFTLAVSFDNILAQEPLYETGASEDGWLPFGWLFTPDRDMDDATLRIHVTKPYHYIIDQVSVMPLSWKERYGGMRPDLLNAIADLRPPVIRWPGGCFASAYRWKSGIGEQHERVPYPFSIWDDREVNSFGTDEFIELCRRVGAEPIIVVNAGTPGWNSKRTPESANVDWPQEAADWVEYCNGPATSKWGKVRAENGHPAPYNVKYWEIDNETQGGVTVEEYIGMIRKMVPAMKQVDPTIKIIVAGSHYGPRLPWDRPIINQVGDLFDYLSFHQYDSPDSFVEGPKKIGDYFRRLQKIIAASPNPTIKIYDSEWNAQSTDWRTGLYAGGMLNEFERCSDIVEMAGPALFLRHTSATDWDNAFINFDQTGWFPAPNYVVMKLWRDHYAPNLLTLTGSQELPTLDAVATRTEDGSKIHVKMVNKADTPCPVEFTLNNWGDRTVETVTLKTVSGRLADRNTLEEPYKLAPQDGTAEIVNDVIHVMLPPYSTSVLTLQ